MDRAGIVGADGPTHQGMYDIVICVASQYGLDGSKNEAELQQMVVTGVNYTDGPSPCYPRGNGYGVPLMEEGWEALPIKGEILRHGDDVLIVGLARWFTQPCRLLRF